MSENLPTGGEHTEEPTLSMPTVKGAVARRRMIGAAVELFQDHGYEGTSVREVADASGVAKATIYHYFPTKSALLYEIHDEFMSTLEAGMREIEGRELDPAEHLRAIIHDLWRVMTVHRGEVRVFFEEWRHLDRDHLDGLRQRRDNYTSFVRRAVEDVASSSWPGGLDDRTADALTLAVFGMCNWAYQWFDPEGPLTGEELAELYADLAITGLSVGRKES